MTTPPSEPLRAAAADDSIVPAGPNAAVPVDADAGASPLPIAPDAATDVQADSAARAARARSRYTLLSVSHAFIDVFPILFVTLMLPLERELGLTEWQVRAVYMITPIFSGAFQPLFAWLSDRFNTRIFSPLGLVIGALAIGSIGFAQSFEQLVALQIVGVIATGFYHPVSTALAGQTGARGFRHGRAFAVGLFIAAGMVGQTISSYSAPILVDNAGLGALVWLVPPALIVALVLHQVVRHIPHRHDNHHEVATSLDPAERRARIFTVGLLTVQNCLRFTANVGIFALFNVWAESKLPDENAASRLAGTMIAANTVGMALSVVLAGRLSKQGAERWTLALLSFAGAGVYASVGFAGDALWPAAVEMGEGSAAGYSQLALLPLFALLLLPPLGFFATFPITASLGQRLLPSHTSVVTSLLMGVGWAASSTHALLAPAFLGADLTAAPTELPAHEIALAFSGFAALMVLSGLLALAMPRHIVAAAAEHR